MNTLVRTKASAAWLTLTVLTAFSWALGTEHGFAGHHVSASLVILAVAVFKIRLIGLYFMELRDAPLVLRTIFESYCGILLVVLATMYLLG